MTTQSPPLSFLSLNCEGHKHLHERILPFLEQQHPDIVCLQEIFHKDLPEIQAKIGEYCAFVPLSLMSYPDPDFSGPPEPWGIAICSRFPLKDIQHLTYVGSGDITPWSPETPNILLRKLLWAAIQVNTQTYTIAVTHFTWSDAGQVTDEQRRDFQKLLGALENIPELVLCGDFNTPRGKEIFDTLAQRYTDNIPSKTLSTLDPELHRAKGKQLVVDVLFSTPEYQVTNVHVLTGLSDHCGIWAEINKE